MATAPKKQKVYVRPSRATLNRPLKMVKLVQPRCKKCNPGGKGRYEWWLKCTHDPYVTTHEEYITIPKLEEQPDGRILKVGEDTEVEYHIEPNMKQVADDEKVASGRMVKIQMERGAKFPEELGYAPICDYNNCWEPNPSFHTRRGNFHTRDEAAIMELRTSETPIYLGMDSDIQRRRRQLDQTAID